MKKTNLKKMILTAIFAAIAVVGSMFSVPVAGSKCAPIQHLVNVLCAIFLGPWYGLAAAFIASVLRNLMGLGTLLAFPGSMCGALLSGLLYRISGKRFTAYFGEMFGTGVIGGMLAYPVAAFLMGNSSATLFMFVIPFLISTIGGTILASILCETLAGSGLLARLKRMLGDESNEGNEVHNADGRSAEGYNNT
ncbi:MAG: energy coupling factor transporter S component ThiW [Lachnospiraceae bacterium]|jgi:energy coupling factor transporter S component ThiW|nr:energy coupling factor transporter S component ThiW [Lachnospiraceae bacterium]